MSRDYKYNLWAVPLNVTEEAAVLGHVVKGTMRGGVWAELP